MESCERLVLLDYELVESEANLLRVLKESFGVWLISFECLFDFKTSHKLFFILGAPSKEVHISKRCQLKVLNGAKCNEASNVNQNDSEYYETARSGSQVLGVPSRFRIFKCAKSLEFLSAIVSDEDRGIPLES